MPYPSHLELAAGLPHLDASPRDHGRLEAIVVRPAANQRKDLECCRLEILHGADGDRWVQRFPSPPLPGSEEHESQLTIINSRAVALLAGTRERWSLAGDQLYVDLHLGEENLRPGDRLAIGTVILEVTSKPHNGCRKFAARYGDAALAFVSSPEGKFLRLRGIYARVVQPGEVRVGDRIDRITKRGVQIQP